MTDEPETELDGPAETTPRELHDRLQSGDPVSVLDLRDRDEAEQWPIEGADAAQVPYARAVQAQVTGAVPGPVEDLDEPVVVVCPRGEASAEVAGFLREAGIEARNLAGGMEAWARLTVARELDLADRGGGGRDGGEVVRVVQYERPSSGCLAYLVHDGEVGALVDPLRAFADRYVEDAADRDVEIRYAVDTHVHADHLSGVRRVADLADAEVVVPAGTRDRGLAFEATTVADGDVLQVGDADLVALHAPGHTSEMTAFLVGDGRDERGGSGTASEPPVLLSGDSLFLDGVARPDLEDASEAEAFAGRLYETLQERVLELPGGTIVAPGHRGPSAPLAGDDTYTATIGDLVERLGVLSMERERFVERITANAPPRPANHERVVAVNLGLESVDDEEAFELELGPNNCAARAD